MLKKRQRKQNFCFVVFISQLFLILEKFVNKNLQKFAHFDNFDDESDCKNMIDDFAPKLNPYSVT